MAKLRVHNLATSLDGYAAGPAQSLSEPLGIGGEALHDFFWKTRFGSSDPDAGETGLDNDVLEAGVDNIGAHIMGRNMFGPVRGPWPDKSWTGWWGDEPPYHHDVFVLTHHPRESVAMKGGTTFHFVTDGIEAALSQALTAANGKDVRVGGGVATVRAYLKAGLVDEMHVPVVPILLGGGERLLGDDATAGYRVDRFAASETVAHYWFVRR
ncbi:dihydrofolate reductase family protein [Actinoplanes sp. LDG1-06]|uniref:Dihydrofolate reductase family protein n=1 Tax=Paractinoplanes ovalisporus TaxID=2810368 RepID=A0ABS2AH31_9ACTN|nr:dihydrofolate reductase family protein [Actinoplanes ovalisporus]MBM2618668.1 dihydrofolate reductase family protein [Actinoplanes ovalisporus]